MPSGKRLPDRGRYLSTSLSVYAGTCGKISAGILALILFSGPGDRAAASMALTETIGTIPEGKMEVSLRGEYFSHDGGYIRESMGAGFGILPVLSASFQVQYLHDGDLSSGGGEVGDSFIRIWLYLGDFFRNTLHAGALFHFRLPTGPNAYTDPRWRNLSFGNNELKMGPVLQFDAGRVFIHCNLFYVFRERNREGFYNTIYLNPLERQTYAKVFGLNFLSDKTFLEPERLKNDYAVFGLAVNTDAVHPFIPYAELYTSRRVYRKEYDTDSISIEGAGINPLLLSAGCRYFFSDSTFAGVYLVVNPVREQNYFREVAGVDAGMQF
jgi:hypothetical protein